MIILVNILVKEKGFTTWLPLLAGDPYILSKYIVENTTFQQFLNQGDFLEMNRV